MSASVDRLISEVPLVIPIECVFSSTAHLRMQPRLGIEPVLCAEILNNIPITLQLIQ